MSFLPHGERQLQSSASAHKLKLSTENGRLEDKRPPSAVDGAAGVQGTLCPVVGAVDLYLTRPAPSGVFTDAPQGYVDSVVPLCAEQG